MNKAELGAAGVNSQARSHTHKVGVWLGLMGAWTGNQTSDTVCHPHTTVICGLEVCFAAWKLEPSINLFLLGQRVWVACRRFGICLLEWYFALSVTSVFNYKCHLHANRGVWYVLLESVDQRDRTFARKREGIVARVRGPDSSSSFPLCSMSEVGLFYQPMQFCCQEYNASSLPGSWEITGRSTHCLEGQLQLINEFASFWSFFQNCSF